jgi:CRISPR-associated endonuclease Csn1
MREKQYHAPAIKWRLGIDLGTNSLGWCALAIDENRRPYRILAMGSRIFSDGRDAKSGASLAIDRRAARAMRRRQDRLKQRQEALIKYLTADGLFPVDEIERKALEGLDPYELRARALDEPLPPFHLGRVFFQLNQRRGFKSNRKADRGKDDDAGKIAVGVDRLRTAIAEHHARTFGEFLHKRRAAAMNANTIPSVRARLRPETGEGAKGDGYDFYPGRDLVDEEFNAIWEAQAPYHQDLLTPEVRERLHEIVFHQRPLKAPKIGTCTLVPGEERLARAHPLFQRRRLLEEVNQLEIILPGLAKQKLTKDQRDKLVMALEAKQKISFESLRKKTLKLDPDARFNKESDNRKELAGDEIYAQFSDKKRFGNRWGFFSTDEQWTIISRLRDEEDEAKLRDWLKTTYELTGEQVKAVASTHLPEGYGRFGLTATQDLIEELEKDVIPYSDAVVRAGFTHHSDFRTGKIFTDEKGHPALPYYGVALERFIMPGTGNPDDPEEMRIGRITNPTVHIGLNQLRRTVNTLIRAYGPPAEIALELARELKMNDEQKDEANKKNVANRRAAEQSSTDLRALGKPDTGANRALLKLWKELNPDNVLDRRCVYSGQQISIDMLFNGLTEVDHILPFSETLDDSNGNKILCLREANRQKRKRSPYEAFGASSDWDDIAARAARLPKEKRWRFEPDAMERFEKEGGFLARQLVDTQYLSRLAREYVSTLYPGEGEKSSHVWVSPGRLTEMVRRKLGLNDLLPDHNIGSGADQPKNRLDHRHHAIDAFVIAIVDRSLLQDIARASGQDGREGRERIIIPPPWEGFRDELRGAVNKIVVSHRLDHGTASKAGLKKGRDQTAGRLHNDTAYGLTHETDAKGNQIVVHRVPLTALKADDFLPNVIKGVRDPELRTALREFTRGTEGKNFEAALRRFPTYGPLQFRGIRRLRIVEPLTVIPIRDASGRAYKGYKGDSNYRYDVWEMPDGKWQAEVVSMFDAHKAGWLSSVRVGCPTARKVLSLQQNDLIAIEQDDERRIMRIVKFGQSGQITLVEPQEAGDLKRRDALPIDQDPFKYMAPTAGGLKKLQARQIRIDELGRVQDPGFPARKRRRITRPKPS